jgi:hypothetical protein
MSTKKKRLQGEVQPLTPEERADKAIRSVLGLNKAELAEVYRSQTLSDPAQKLYEIATKVASEYEGRGEALPVHVAAMLASARQQELPLDGLSLASSIPKLLLVDAEVDRMIGRKATFERQRYRVEIAFTVPEALLRLESENFHAVIVDWTPVSPDEMDALHAMQRWNVRIPVINVSAWTSFTRENERQFNWNLVRALARALGRRVPRSLPQRKSVSSDSERHGGKDQLFETTG